MTDKRSLRFLETRLKRITTAVKEAEQEMVDLIADAEYETGPESSREEMAPALSGGDKTMARLATA